MDCGSAATVKTPSGERCLLDGMDHYLEASRGGETDWFPYPLQPPRSRVVLVKGPQVDSPAHGGGVSHRSVTVRSH